MSKQPEEGEIWEWRAFGRISENLASQVRAYPIRMGLSDLQGEDVYFISSGSDHNIKLRKQNDSWILKFKLLLGGAPGEAELYTESAAYAYQFPVKKDTLTTAAALLKVKLRQKSPSALTADEFARSLAKASPPVSQAEVKKRRSQFEFENGWLELADVWFPKRQTQSISIHSHDKEAVDLMRERLTLDQGWEIINYVEACRRWA